MSVFTEQCFFFLRQHDGGVEDLAKMKAAGFGGVFCNIGDASTPSHWDTVRQRARDQGMFCGPWLRTANAHNQFDAGRLDFLIETADAWDWAPLIVNSEKEIDHSDDQITSYIAQEVGDREAAISVECWPFSAVDWTPLFQRGYPILPQIFPAEVPNANNPEACRQEWYRRGAQCVYFTFGSYGGMRPDEFNLQAPYSIYTADDCGYDYAAWSPTSHGYVGCQDGGPSPPDGGGDMTKIGNQDGIVAACNKLRDLDPSGTILYQDPDGKWADISTLPSDMGKWKAWDKLQRTLQILKDDHDGAL